MTSPDLHTLEGQQKDIITLLKKQNELLEDVAEGIECNIRISTLRAALLLLIQQNEEDRTKFVAQISEFDQWTRPSKRATEMSKGTKEKL